MEKIEKNNLTIALNILRAKKEYNIRYKNNIKIYSAYVLKHNRKREKGWHYIAVKKNYQHYQEDYRQNITVIFIV